MTTSRFDKLLRRFLNTARERWYTHARSDEPDEPGFSPLLIVITKRGTYFVDLAPFSKNKRGTLHAAGIAFWERFAEKPRAIFLVFEAWYALPSPDVERYVRDGGSLSDLGAARKEALTITGLLPDGTTNAAVTEIVRTNAGEAALGKTVILDAGRESLEYTLGAFYEGYRLRRARG